MLIFDGAIAGMGTESGTRLVVGMWPSSPLGSIADVMVEASDGWRTLLAPSAQVADFISATYVFDDISIVPVSYRRQGSAWSVTAGPLRLNFTTGRRKPLGMLLSVLPRPIARSRWWASLVDPIARRVLPGVRTRGSAGGGRREWYAAVDMHPIIAVDAFWNDSSMGCLTDVHPPVRFGFGSTPAKPSLVRVRTTIDLGADQS